MPNRVPLVSKDGDYFSQLKQTTCPYCGVGCGVETKIDQVETGLSLSDLKGIENHPANHGRLCVKGSHLLDTLTPSNRLLHPQINNQQVNWERAISEVAHRLSQTIAQYGPDAVGFYVSGQLLTEDYYVANKFIKGFIGTANIDTNSRLCMSSAVAAYKRAFGEDAVPCNYQDLEHTDLLIFIGSNAAWTHPVLFQRVERAKKLNPHIKIVVIDPRQTATCAIADLHLPIKPGTDAAVYNGLLNYLVKHAHIDSQYIAQHTEGFEKVITSASSWTIEKVADYCQVASEKLLTFFDLFAQSINTISFYSMGINQSTSGVDKANSIINCHLATGKIGRRGSGPFSITGQPNAMGGREVGGLANMLAAHMDFGNPEHEERVARFWQTPNLASKPGLKAVDLFDAVNDGQIKFLWIMATNPVVSMPNRNVIENALKNCEHLIVSEVALNSDTAQYADVLLPACAWSEKDGTVTNSERCISRQRQLIPPIGEARPDWKIITDVAKKMGFHDAFNYDNPAQIFDEHAQLTAFENDNERKLDLSSLVGLTPSEYDSLSPIQWPVNAQYPNGCPRLFEDGQFSTPSGKANFITVEPRLPEQQTCETFPFVLNSGRYRDQWHTMTRTGNAPALLQHSEEPHLSLHPSDARQLALKDGELVKLIAKHDNQSQAILPVKIQQEIQKGHSFAPIHWSKSWGANFTVGALFSSANDPISGQPELKHGAISISKVQFKHYLQLSCQLAIPNEILNQNFAFWQKIPTSHHVTYLLADNHSNAMETACRSIEHDEVYSAKVNGCMSKLLFKNMRFVGAIWRQDTRFKLPLDWLDYLFSNVDEQPHAYPTLLRAEPDEDFLKGPIICSCFHVRAQTIKDEIKCGAVTVDALSKKLKCGTNCGSCRSEISNILHQSELVMSSTSSE